jgi:hypothetical protein
MTHKDNEEEFLEAVDRKVAHRNEHGSQLELQCEVETMIQKIHRGRKEKVYLMWKRL